MSFDETGLSDAGSDRFTAAQPEKRPPAQTPSWGAKRCPACQTPVLHNQIVCAECGTRLAPRITRIRCRRCRQRATSDHVICPHCGRELRAAPPRLLTLGVPALLLGALAVTLIARGAPSFLQNNDSLPLIQNFEITPVAADSEPNVRPARESLAPAVVQSGVGQAAGPPPSVEGPPSDPFPTSTPTAQASDTVAAETEPQDSVNQATETPAAPAVQPAETSTAVAERAVETPTPAPSPAASETQAPTLVLVPYTIQQGDTPAEIADNFGIETAELMEANDMSESEARNLQPGQEILVPLRAQATATSTPTATPAATATATSQG